MGLINYLLRKIVTVGILALTVPIAAQTMVGEDAELDAEMAAMVSSQGTALLLKDAGVDAEDLARGWSVVLRSKEEAQAALDRRYRIEE